MKSLLVLWLTIFSLALNAQTNYWQNKIDASLWKKAEAGTLVECIVVLKQQADLSLANNLKTKEEKGNFVFNSLQTTARESQKPILQLLQNEKARYQSFFMLNAIYTQADARLLRQLAEREEVAYLADNPAIPLQLPTVASADEVASRSAIEWGIQRINADQVWALGYKGQGVVVGGQDTGYEWTHPAIQGKYRGWNGSVANHNYNWHDAIHKINPLNGDTTNTAANPCGVNSKVPCDDNSHGTHTMGTMVGDDGKGNQIGVAPDARWIAVRNMERGWGSPASYIESFEWFIAPTNLEGRNPDPSKAPHVINNSWGCPPVEGCNESNFTLMNSVVNNVRAAGIVVVASAGNSGNNCSTVSDPASIFAGSFSIGASRQNDTIALFSSRGPVSVDGSNRLKPNVVAPGVGVRSAVRGGGYANFNGTSMAGPHVAGLVALMISANPDLAGQVEKIETIIEETAKPMQTTENCGGLSGLQIPNNTYGYGRVDALAAVERALQLTADTDDIKNNIKVSVFPNPTEQNITFKIEGVNGKTELQLFNAAGQQLQYLQWDAQHISLQPLDLQNLPTGIYIYRLKNGGTTTSGKIVKQ
ncbi:MAG: S8 family serine peptidase [Saprospiraceae bacterium]